MVSKVSFIAHIPLLVTDIPTVANNNKLLLLLIRYIFIEYKLFIFHPFRYQIFSDSRKRKSLALLHMELLD